VRFEVSAAFVIGWLLPVLETVRRGFGHWAVEATTMLEDYLAGALLLLAGLAAARGARFAPPLLLAAWAGVTTMMTISLIGQVEETVRAVDLEPGNSVVLVAKLLLWASCAFALLRSFRVVRERMA
jgi:hypothetical protein